MGGEAGQALPLALAVLGLAGLVVAPFLGHTGTSLISSRTHDSIIAENYTADAGVEHAIWMLASDPPSLPHSYQLSGVNSLLADITIQDEGADRYKITSISGNITIEAHAVVPGGVIQGDVTLSEGEEHEGNVYATGDVTLEDGVEVQGNIVAGGDVTLGDDSEVKGDVCAGGDVILNGHTEIEHGDCVCGDDIYVNWGGGGSSGKAEIENDIYALGDVYVGEDAEVEADIYTDGTVADPWSNVSGNIYPYQGCPCGACSVDNRIVSWKIN